MSLNICAWRQSKWIFPLLPSAKSKVRKQRWGEEGVGEEEDLMETGVTGLVSNRTRVRCCLCAALSLLSAPHREAQFVRGHSALWSRGGSHWGAFPVIFIICKTSLKGCPSGCITVCHRGKCFPSFFADILIHDLWRSGIQLHLTGQEAGRM